MGEAVLEDATAQIRLELVEHEFGQTAGLLRSLAEARPMLLDQLIEQSLLGSTALVAVLPWACRASCGRMGHRHGLSVAASRRCMVSGPMSQVAARGDPHAGHPADPRRIGSALSGAVTHRAVRARY